MLRAETEHLGTVIGELLAGINRQADFYPDWQYRAIAALHSLERGVNVRYFSSVKDPGIRRYVRYHQNALTLLSDRLFKFLELAIGQDDDAVAVAGALLQKLEYSIKALEANYYGAIDPTSPVTLYSRKVFAMELEPLLKEMNLTANDIRSNDLLTAVRISFQELLADTTLRFNDLELDRIRSLSQLTLKQIHSPEGSDDHLFGRLYAENFNSPALAEWYQRQLLSALSGLPDEEQFQRLTAETQRLSITGLAPKQAFDRRRENITEQLPVWLAKLNAQVLAGRTRTEGNLARLPLELSVAQLGLFLRLCQLTGCFHEHNISAVLRFFNQHFTSKKQNHISQKSLAKAFYSAEQSTAASNRAWLQRMIDHLNKKYFPK